MKILSVTAQKPHSTGSGTYLTELVNNWHLFGHDQAVVAGVYEQDEVNFPEGVAFYPTTYTRRASRDTCLTAGGHYCVPSSLSFDGDGEGMVSGEENHRSQPWL